MPNIIDATALAQRLLELAASGYTAVYVKIGDEWYDVVGVDAGPNYQACELLLSPKPKEPS